MKKFFLLYLLSVSFFVVSCGKSSSNLAKTLSTTSEVTSSGTISNTSEATWDLKFETNDHGEIQLTDQKIDPDIDKMTCTFNKVDSDLTYTTELELGKVAKQIGTLDGQPLFAYLGLCATEGLNGKYTKDDTSLAVHLFTGKGAFISIDDNKCIVIKIANTAGCYIGSLAQPYNPIVIANIQN